MICAPWTITEELVASLGIHSVVRGTSNDANADDDATGEEDRNAVPKRLGKFLEIPSSSTLSVEMIVNRIGANEERFRGRFLKKMAAEKEYYEARYGTGAAGDGAEGAGDATES